MPVNGMEPLIRHRRRPALPARTDGQFLRAFIEHGDAAAFDALLRRERLPGVRPSTGCPQRFG